MIRVGSEVKHGLDICLDTWHCHSTESVADKISVYTPYVNPLLIHVSVIYAGIATMLWCGETSCKESWMKSSEVIRLVKFILDSTISARVSTRLPPWPLDYVLYPKACLPLCLNRQIWLLRMNRKKISLSGWLWWMKLKICLLKQFWIWLVCVKGGSCFTGLSERNTSIWARSVKQLKLKFSIITRPPMFLHQWS